MQVATGSQAGHHMMQRLTMKVGETIYGLGERFGPVVRNGQSVTMWNDDGGTVSDQAYKNIPFYLSSAGYGLLVNTPGAVEFEIGTERVSQVQFSAPQQQMDYYFFYGPEPKNILEKYTRLAGRPALPPDWSFGLWLSTSFLTHYDEKTVTEFVAGMASRGIPLSVLHFDCFWMKQRHWCDFQWDQDAFPDVEGMLKRLHALGVKICVWINPYISGMSSLYAQGRDNGYFLKRGDGSVYQMDDWQPGQGVVDFTNPSAVKWYQGALRKLLELGVDCFKTDFGERIPADAVYHDGSDPKLAHNYYSYLYNKAVFEVLEDFHGTGNAIVFARAATCGGQKFPVHWGGDCLATFESMAEDFRGGLSFCMSGPCFWSHDIGGFTGKANPSLYKRWVAFGLLSSHSRLHGQDSYRVPWIFDDEAVDVMRSFAKLKNRLFPYIFAAAHEAHESGAPVMRHMLLEFPDDPACAYLDRQYMLGGSLLVAPIFREDNIAEYYLPEGTWTHLLTGQTVSGGRWQRGKFDFFSLPLFVRENTLLALSCNDRQTRFTSEDELELRIYQLAEGGVATTRVHTAGGVTVFTAKRSGDAITLSSEGTKVKARVVINGKSTDWADAGQSDHDPLLNRLRLFSFRELHHEWTRPDSAVPLDCILAPFWP